MEFSRAGLVRAAEAAGFTQVSERLVTDWGSKGLLARGVRSSRGKGKGTGAHYVWPEAQKELFLALLEHREEVRYVDSLAVLPVSTWIYWGDNYVPLHQAKLATATWWGRASSGRSYESLKQQARQMVKAIAGNGGSRATRAALRDALLDGLERQDFDSDRILPLVTELLNSESNGAWGPFQSSPEEVLQQLQVYSIAMGHYEDFTDEDFFLARSRIRQHTLAYIQNQPRLSSNPAFGSWFQEPTYQLFIDQSCRSLIGQLGGMWHSRESGRMLPPVPNMDWEVPPPEIFQRIT